MTLPTHVVNDIGRVIRYTECARSLWNSESWAGWESNRRCPFRRWIMGPQHGNERTHSCLELYLSSRSLASDLSALTVSLKMTVRPPQSRPRTNPRSDDHNVGLPIDGLDRTVNDAVQSRRTYWEGRLIAAGMHVRTRSEARLECDQNVQSLLAQIDNVGATGLHPFRASPEISPSSRSCINSTQRKESRDVQSTASGVHGRVQEAAVQRIRDGQGVSAVARELGMSTQTLRNWMKALASPRDESFFVVRCAL